MNTINQNQETPALDTKHSNVHFDEFEFGESVSFVFCFLGI